MSAKQKILLVSNGFYPELSPRSNRATELAIEFNKQGHEVVVITKFRHHYYGEFLRQTPIKLKMWAKPKLFGIPNFKNKLINRFGQILSRFLLLAFEYPGIEEMFLVRKVLKEEFGYNLLISFAVPYPVHWGVAWARTSSHRIADIWVADCGDPYMGDVLDTFRKPFYFSFLEKWFCSKADYLSIPIKGAMPGYYHEFHYKIKVIPQGFEFNLNDLHNEEPRNDVPTFAYAGGFLPGARDPKPLLDYLVSTTLPFRFLIYTKMIDQLSEYKSRLGDKLEIHDYVPRAELMKILPKMDFLINFDNNTPLNAPSKIIDYAIVGRPVLNITKEFPFEGLQEFLKGDYRKRMIIPKPEQYHIGRIAQLFIDLLMIQK